MKNLARNLILGISCSAVINCADTGPRYVNYFGNIPYVLYQAKAGEDIKKLYQEEGGNLKDSLGFSRFQADIYHKAKENNETSRLRWKNGKLEIIKDGIIIIRDLNEDNKAGKPKIKLSRPNYTLCSN